MTIETDAVGEIVSFAYSRLSGPEQDGLSICWARRSIQRCRLLADQVGAQDAVELLERLVLLLGLPSRDRAAEIDVELAVISLRVWKEHKSGDSRLRPLADALAALAGLVNHGFGKDFRIVDAAQALTAAHTVAGITGDRATELEDELRDIVRVLSKRDL
jgi:hypothetical protein